MYGAEVIRRRRHLEKVVVVDAIGITTTTLKKLEEETPGNMSLYVYLCLAEYYGVTIDDLLEEYIPTIPSARGIIRPQNLAARRRPTV